MNLLSDTWIPVRYQQKEGARQIALETLLCSDEKWELTLPRDDMELAALQLLICIVQVLLPPTDIEEWKERIRKPLSVDNLKAAVKDYQNWFQINHPTHPFMQVKGVKADTITPMDKLLAGLNTSTNSRFVNEPNLAKGLCFGCAAIALYNLANNAPSFGGGFKFGIRRSCPVSTFAQGDDLRSTVWLNVLSQKSLDKCCPEWRQPEQKPTWVNPIEEKSTIPVHTIGLLRGLLWQPGHIELISSENRGQCSCCDYHADKLFTGIRKAKFPYTIEGLWKHPHSPQVLTLKKERIESEYFRFKSVPAWTQLSHYVVKRDLSASSKDKEGQEPALVIQQLKEYLKGQAHKLELLTGGYRNNQAAILERCHEVLTLNRGWEVNTDKVHELVEHGLKYRDALSNALYTYFKGIKKGGRKIKGAGLTLHKIGETQFYRRSEDLVLNSLAHVDFNNTLQTLIDMDTGLKKICESIFTELTNPYQHDPELFRTLTKARHILQKRMKEIRVPKPTRETA